MTNVIAMHDDAHSPTSVDEVNDWRASQLLADLGALQGIETKEAAAEIKEKTIELLCLIDGCAARWAFSARR